MNDASIPAKGPPIEWMDEVESTQVVARERVHGGLTVARAFAARVQTRGYGRHGRVWQSPQGGLWMTVALPDFPAIVMPSAGLRVGVACGRVIEGMIDGAAKVSVKWPNDLLIDGAKICGVLCESFVHGGRSWLLVGIGINANNGADSLPGHLRRPATALVEWTRAPIDVSALGEAVSREVARSLAAPLEHSVIEWAAIRLWRVDQTIGVRGADGVRSEAVVRGLNVEGCLVVEVAGQRGAIGVGDEIED